MQVDVAELRMLRAKATRGEWSVQKADAPHDYGADEAYEVHIADGRPPSVMTGAFYADPHDANLACAAVNALHELLRVYEAWQGAAEGVAQAASGSDGAMWLEVDGPTPEQLDAINGQRVKLVPAAEDGGR